jgi:hypothetical protein
MPASVTHDCPACSAPHELILFSADAFDWADLYEYTCPTTADLVCVRVAELGSPTGVKRENAVSVRPIGSAG